MLYIFLVIRWRHETLVKQQVKQQMFSVKIQTNGIISLKVKIYICISSSSIESQDC